MQELIVSWCAPDGSTAAARQQLEDIVRAVLDEFKEQDWLEGEKVRSHSMFFGSIDPDFLEALNSQLHARLGGVPGRCLVVQLDIDAQFSEVRVLG